jgi:hypothetical protein
MSKLSEVVCTSIIYSMHILNPHKLNCCNSSGKFSLFITLALLFLSGPLVAGAQLGNSSGVTNDFISDAHAMQVLIMPSSSQVASGDVLNITYLVKNNGNSTMMNISLLTDEKGPFDLNVSVLLPGQSAAGNESISVSDGNLPGPIIRTAKVKADNTLGENVSGENSTSIYLLNNGSK